jgi:hypothetical protein
MGRDDRQTASPRGTLDTGHPAVRAAILAYRRRCQAGPCGHHEAWLAACVAWSEHAALDGAQVSNAIHYASMMDPVWFWAGVPADWEWPRRNPGTRSDS